MLGERFDTLRSWGKNQKRAKFLVRRRSSRSKGYGTRGEHIEGRDVMQKLHDCSKTTKHLLDVQAFFAERMLRHAGKRFESSSCLEVLCRPTHARKYLDLQALFAEQMLQHAGERSKAAAITSKRTFIERKLVRTFILASQLASVGLSKESATCTTKSPAGLGLCESLKFWPLRVFEVRQDLFCLAGLVLVTNFTCAFMAHSGVSTYESRIRNLRCSSADLWKLNVISYSLVTQTAVHLHD